MSLMTHIQQLKQKHDRLSQEVESAQRSPSMDALQITDMKKEKLRLKEEITRLSIN